MVSSRPWFPPSTILLTGCRNQALPSRLPSTETRGLHLQIHRFLFLIFSAADAEGPYKKKTLPEQVEAAQVAGGIIRRIQEGGPRGQGEVNAVAEQIPGRGQRGSVN